MKKHIIAFGTLFLLAAAGLAAFAQDDTAVAQAAARLAARRAAEQAGTAAAPAAPAHTAAEERIPSILPIPPIPPIAANSADSSAEEQAAEALRKANLAAAYKQIQASSNSLLVSKPFLQVVWQRNVFDHARVPYNPPSYRQPPVIEAFSLRGISEIIGKGLVAFFGGDGVPPYPPTRVVGDFVGGKDHREFKITAITWTNVTLLDTKFTPRPAGSGAASPITGPEIVLNLDEGLTRTDDGPWTTNDYRPVYPTFVARNPLDRATMLSPPAPFPPPMDIRVPRNGPSVPGGGVLPSRRVPRGSRGGVSGFAPPAAVAAPATASDPAVLARLQAQRSAE